MSISRIIGFLREDLYYRTLSYLIKTTLVIPNFTRNDCLFKSHVLRHTQILKTMPYYPTN